MIIRKHCSYSSRIKLVPLFKSRRQGLGCLLGQRVTDSSAGSPSVLRSGLAQAFRVLGHTPGTMPALP